MKDRKKNTLTTASGAPVDNDQNTVTAGARGPALQQDVHLMEKLAHFNRERIPERVVHAKGAGAHGYFEVTGDVRKYTKAKFLSEVGKRTEVFARFSTVGGEKGSADSARDPLKFPDFIHTQKRNPATNAHDADMFWDFLSLTPESVHQVTILFSDRGTPKGHRHMNGYSSHTFKWYNERGEYFWVQYHFKTNQGIENLTRQEAERMAGEDPDYATRDLYEAIAGGDYPSWRVCVQIMTPEEAKGYRFDIFDITKVWPHGDFPLIEIGQMVLNRNPENYFAEVEQAAFSPGNFVPGIASSPDKMLQARIHSYNDAHLYRLGANYQLLPINAPKATVANNYQRDGFMRFDANGGGGPNYYPNSMGGPEPQPGTGEPAFEVSGMAGRYEYSHPNDDFVQAGDLYRKVMSDEDRDHLVGNIVAHLCNAQKRIQRREAAVFYRADGEYGRRVAAGLGLDIKDIEKLAAMSNADRARATMA